MRRTIRLATLLLIPHLCAADWVLDQIKTDLAPFKNQSLTKVSLKEFVQQTPLDILLVYIQIRDGRVSSYCPGAVVHTGYQTRLEDTHQFLKALAKNYPIADTEFILTLHDCRNADSSMPIFSFAKSAHSTAILIPDFEILSRNDELFNMCEKASEKHPWKTKQEVVFWRGATTGGVYEINNYFSFPRGMLVYLSTQYPEWLDAGFNTLVQGTPEVYHFITTQIKPLAKTVSIPDHFQYKYLVDVDGNSSTYSRCRWILLSNSVLIKADSENVQWYYKALVPWVHFIPVEAHFQNLPDVYAWLKSHDAEAFQIASQGRDLGKIIFSKKEIERYVVTLLNEYTKLFRR